MSPRRSSRARTTQPPASVPPAHSTSSSSVSSTRTERATRANHKQSTPQKSSTPHSLSSEDAEEPPRGSQAEPPQTRRRAREQDNDEDSAPKAEEALEDEEEDEVTRCVCGQQEYPGPPADIGKSRDGQATSLTESDVQNDDAGGLFIQCDICKVWQHGGCVGIMDEAASPDEYFCEECRKDLHKLMTSAKGQKYSRYLPVWDQSHAKNARKSSVSKESDRPLRDKDRLSRASAESFSKRRSTMNSRAAYDEDEALRKALEESTKEGGVPASDDSSRKKRSREDSEDDIKQENKRQRTSSRTPSNSPVVESEDDTSKSTTAKQKPRGAAARSQREKEQREKERERERAEAANRRKGRAERRKAEDLKPAPAPRKSGRPPVKRQSRLGRNQYTRDAPTPATNGASPAAHNDVPASPQISITNGAANGNESSDGAAVHKPTKSKNWRLEKLSWNDIKRPAGAMQNYITQRQVELAGDKRSSASATQSPSKVNGEPGHEESKTGNDDVEVFKNMDTLQMMDELSRELVHWQRMVAEQTEK
ncbi:hypothetical protein P154DRAFT_438062 [Amniculicola lignicola CBS 123094]|uniref:Zinc finger PHD-type domain-containing protein n=1 Tax=Amniculicola lignicola CBS 123094 TaxID=1392246 RepID=A0A6A5WMZ1_9PLEO|nr:hypothetical protein P154DRAFT_438062 [Amniculicola lignicola CBS 123094]